TYTTTGQFTAKAKPTSLYTRVLEHHPATRLALMGAALVAGWSLARRLGR
ncbi:MAG: short-chain dehydrogenase, partial [Sphaerobacter sp.]|nr:short-chain dehydrogenase [Sphaerobacter sp.]